MNSALAPSLLPSMTRPNVDLNGPWRFSLDPGDVGVTESWFCSKLSHSISVPGSWEEQGYGDRPAENIGGWTKRRSYEGAAWYQRDIDIPADWPAGRAWIQFDRVGWQSTLWVNDCEIGTRNSISTPHRYDVSEYVRPGQSIRISVRVANVLPDLLNYEGHIHSRHTATTWGGIIGAVHLVATPRAWIEHIHLAPDARRRRVSADIHLRGETTDAHLFVRISDPEGRTIIEQSFDRKSATEETVIHAELDLGNDARLWSDRDPFLYTIEVQLESDLGLDRVHDRFGLREFVAEGRHLLLNGERFFLRGYVDCCIFPLTGYPPESKETYARQFQIAREWGFNHVRLHSWVPSRVFFEAADEAGILVQCELPNWSNANDPAVVSRVGDFFRSELDNVVVHLQRHPSLVIHSMGNELLQQPPGGMKFRYSPFLNELIQRGKALDPARLFIDQSGFGDVPEEAERLSEVSVLHTFRGSTPDTTASWWPRSGGGAVPVIAHEHTQIDMYARFDEIEKFSGIMEPSWLLQAQASLARRGVLERADRYLAGSAAIQKRCLKELFERIRRTPELAGVQMLNFTDFPGQGTALNGVLDVFWDEKGHITADEFRQFFDETVLLCRTPHRTYRCGAGFRAEILVSHYGQESLTGELHWALTANDRVLAEGRVTVSNVPTGEPWPIGIACAGLPSHETCELTLSVAFKTGHRTITNSWNYWVFDTSRWDGPAGRTLVHRTLAPLSDVYSFLEPDTFGFLNGGPTSPEFGVIVSDVMQVRYVEAMYNGATLVYLAENDELQDGITSRFEPLFWSYLWFTNQPNQTMGLTIDRHPILGSFPHDGFSDWQWFHLVDGATAVGLDTLPGELEPVVGAIDNWNRGKRLGYVFEAKVGRGRFIMTTLKLLDQYPHRPEAVYLLDQLLRYAHKTEVEPGCELTLSDMWSIPKNPVRWAHP